MADAITTGSSSPTSLFDLTARWALVTGGTRGIGGMIAEGLAGAGAQVIVASRSAGAGGPRVHERGATDVLDRLHPVAADVRTEKGCLALAAAVDERTDKLAILVNNAGTAWGAPLESFPAHGWDKVLDVNLKAPFYLTRALLSSLEKASRPHDPARILNIGSIDGLRAPQYPNYSYAASKAALHHLTRVLATELGPRGITVNAIAPGPFETKMTEATFKTHGADLLRGAPLGRVGRAADMAGAAVYLCSPASAYVTGVVLPVDGGIAISQQV